MPTRAISAVAELPVKSGNFLILKMQKQLSVSKNKASFTEI